ncbi:hypothetical protein ILYODFUR_029101 [Ilyodon furcidens]|uniref:Uncharacterized protein n=1 Tax=Ilyodon furcidens TaxID=33524 RepID=A0ABV0V7Q9_9TELE
MTAPHERTNRLSFHSVATYQSAWAVTRSSSVSMALGRNRKEMQRAFTKQGANTGLQQGQGSWSELIGR